jgi:hypothetical protein
MAAAKIGAVGGLGPFPTGNISTLRAALVADRSHWYVYRLGTD